uniref:Secreted protein n=1 Tax=Cacopsylla melanoneura TaxID=428564 RepID=A0A8D8RDI7_9HEMI
MPTPYFSFTLVCFQLWCVRGHWSGSLISSGHFHCYFVLSEVSWFGQWNCHLRECPWINLSASVPALSTRNLRISRSGSHHGGYYTQCMGRSHALPTCVMAHEEGRRLQNFNFARRY